jgi:clan AA aspartic protease
MGTFYYPVLVISSDGDRSETVDALVDTGATYSQVPGSVLRRLGISPTETALAELADGRVVEDEIAEARVRINGLETYTWVTFGPENVAPLLGAHALEGVRMAVDPVGLRLIPARILRM